MFCHRCYNRVDQSLMSRCENCKFFFCEECYMEHMTTPDTYDWKACNPEDYLPNILPKIESKRHKNSTLEYCDECHREFYKSDLIYGPEPFAHEIYNDIINCKLCKGCYHESCMDI